MTVQANQIAFLRAMRGAPASVFLTLLLTRRAHTQDELQIATGYSDKPVSKALHVLRINELVSCDAAGHLWSVTERVFMIPEFAGWHMVGAGSEGGEVRAGGEGDRKDSVRVATTTTTNQSITAGGKAVVSTVSTSSAGKGAVSRGPAAGKGEAGPAPPAVGMGRGQAGDNLRETGDNRPEAGDKAVDNAGYGAGHGSDRGEQAEVRRWLLRGGVGRHSRRMQELLAAGFSVEHVQAFVLEREYLLRQTKRSQGNKPARPYQVGLLIRRLLDGDPAPAMRCETCLERVPCYCGLIVR